MSQTPKGLATVALLKARLDEGHDHLGLFEPLVLDALLQPSTSDFIASDISSIVHLRTGLVLPANTVQTLLARCAKRGFLERRGGRFFRTTMPVPDPHLETARDQALRQQANLALALREFAGKQKLAIASDEAALDALATFVSDNKVPLILRDELPDGPLDRSSQSRRLTRLLARFITEQCLTSPSLRPALEALTEGILLHDVAMMRDLPEASQRFQGLVVALDTQVCFSVLDLEGVANGLSAKEGVTLLREAGATVIVFAATIREMRRILMVYADKLGTTDGRLSLYPTALTQHFLTSRASPADVRVIIATLEKQLEDRGVRVRDLPAHDARYTYDEQALAQCLVDNNHPDPNAPRIRHDVDCVAGIMTLRRGQTSTSIERCMAVLCSSSGRVVRNVQAWARNQGEEGIPPIVHQLALTSIAWLKKPAAAPGIMIHELAATCAAVMRPTRKTWTKMVEALSRLRDDGSITDDETAAVVASDLTEPMLAQLDDELEPDSDSIQEAIERVRDSYRREAQSAADQAVGHARAEAAMVQQAAATSLAKSDRVLQAIERRIQGQARATASIVFAVAICIGIAAAVVSLPGVFESLSGYVQWGARVLVVLAALFGVVSTIRGTSLSDMRAALAEQVRDRLRKRWFADSPSTKSETNMPAATTMAAAGQHGAAADDRPQAGDRG